MNGAGGPSLPVCYSCRERGHIAKKCPQRSNRCSRCGSALGKALACKSCIDSTNGRVNPMVLVPGQKRPAVIEIGDSDDEGSDISSDISPSKMLKIESVRQRIIGPASKTGRAKRVLTASQIKAEPEELAVKSSSTSLPSQPTALPLPTALPPALSPSLSPMPQSSEQAIHYVQLSAMDEAAMCSVIMRDWAQWPANQN